VKAKKDSPKRTRLVTRAHVLNQRDEVVQQGETPDRGETPV